jgi:hypothetical protein
LGAIVCGASQVAQGCSRRRWYCFFNVQDQQRDLVLQYPWLEAMLCDDEASSRSGLGVNQHSNSSQELCSSDAAELSDTSDLEDELLDELRDKRRELGLERDAAEAADFRVKLIGGAWSLKQQGASYVGFSGRTCSVPAEQWCKDYALHMSSYYQIDKFGEHGAHLCASAWCSAMQHFYDLWNLRPKISKYKFTDADVASKPVNKELQELLPSLSASARPRAAKLLQFHP